MAIAKRSAPARAGTGKPAGRGPGRRTLASILRAAGELLDEQGYDGLSTTAVAQRAGISTATLYRHFPDKHAVLRALVVHLQSERADAIERIYEALGSEADWRGPAAEVMRTAYRLRLARPGGRSTRRALQVSPELWQWDQKQTEALAASLAKAIRRRKPAIGRATADRVALVAVATSIALLDLASLSQRKGKALIEESILLREAYLARYLD